MSEKYSIEELIVRFLQQDINEDELRYLKSWLEEDVEHKSYIVKRLENYYDVRIHLDDPRLEQIRYTGTFSLDQDILDVFRIIDYEKQFVFKRIKKDIFIISK